MIGHARQLRPSRHMAFTLVEVMVSLGLMVILMLAVNYIFSNVGRATSATQALSRATRDAQSAQAIMFRDFASADMKNAPFILLRSESVYAFRNQSDRISGPDTSIPPDPRWIVDPSGASSGSVQTSSAIYNDRNHRIDVFSFFARDTFQRQTGGGTISGSSTKVERFVDPMSCQEAWVWYGHTLLPNNNGNFLQNAGPDNGKVTSPGSGTVNSNPNNYHANQFILGRVAMLLQDPQLDPATSTYKITTFEKAGAPSAPPSMDHSYYFNTNPNGTDLTPFSAVSTATDEATTDLAEARYDLLGSSMSSFRTYLQSWINLPAHASPNDNWWDALMLTYRYQASPYVLDSGPERLTPKAVSQQAPIFLVGCAQFIVEYAGDFIAQDNDASKDSFGQIVNAYFDLNGSAPNPIPPDGDGVIDYVVDWNDANQDDLIDTAERSTIQKRIRWYGLPRDVNGDGFILGGGSTRNSNAYRDVVPLRDIVHAGGYTTSASMQSGMQTLMLASSGAPFEKWLSYVADPTLRATTPLLMPAEYVANKTAAEYYTCAWGPADRRPSMIRITIVLDDPEGQLSQPQTYEYIFKMQ